ncbi:adenosine deaminase [Actinoplanes teichomyceticus]|uniref:Adenosine deaminase n=1 Tax=Actinoplanes teichomyceticus TaxID=1867 RepID=A0A561VIQ8_ACTTI|nr:adenosine deaminase [Actinoplanes teichomyceticus]TWG11464.1 adenosine deaminase [Actinoplanes teichomyceticus]GIF15722.1 adenosine deaminase [Actinoplanes teichomyceticus]
MTDRVSTAEIPKAEMHVHLEGTVRPATLLAIARRNDVALPADTVAGLERLYRFTDLQHFIQTWIMTTNCLRTGADFRRITLAYVEEIARQGAVYLEAIFSPAERVQRGVDWDEIFAGYCDAAAEAGERHGVTVVLAPDLYRGIDVRLAEECARVAGRYRDRGITGLGIGGRPEAMPLSAYDRALRIAADQGLAFLPHGGEGCDPESVRELLPYAPARIRHGIGAWRDEELMAELAERRIVLDVCPTSNLRTGAVRDLAEHPLPRLRAAGVRCTVSTDDPAMFHTDLTTEYRVAAGLGVSATDIWAAVVAGATAPEPIRTRLAARVESSHAL